MAARDAIEIAGVRLTSPDKVLYREQAISKRGLAAYYQQVADWILPHLRDRLVTLVRCPDGQHGQCFYQKHAGRAVPDAVKVMDVRERTKTDTYLWIDDVAGLIALVQIGALELHVWGSRRDRLEQPDRMVFDLDPAEGLEAGALVAAARDVRDRLAARGLDSFPMLTGGKGIHVVVPLERRHDWDQVRAYAADLAGEMARAAPERYVAEAAKAKRTGRIFLDYLRNTRGATAICPYSTRARPGAPVATPVRWDELGPSLAPDRYDTTSVLARLARLKADPWQGYDRLTQRL